MFFVYITYIYIFALSRLPRHTPTPILKCCAFPWKPQRERRTNSHNRPVENATPEAIPQGLTRQDDDSKILTSKLFNIPSQLVMLLHNFNAFRSVFTDIFLRRITFVRENSVLQGSFNGGID